MASALIEAGLALLLFGLPGLAFALRARFGFGANAQETERPDRVEFDARTIRRLRPDGAVESIEWETR